MGGAACAAVRLRHVAAVGAALLLLLRLPGAAALHAISCMGTNACNDAWRTCPVDEDCELTFSGYRACQDMTITGPSGDHTLTILCQGSSQYTCRSMQIHAEASTAVSFSCAGTGDYFDFCGYGARVYCPACDQGGCVAGSSSSASSAAGGGGVCVVSCTATHNGQRSTCREMDVFSGPGGAEVACQESGGTSTSVKTCRNLQLHQPSDAADAATAFVEIDCANCAGSSSTTICSGSQCERCCANAEVTPGTSCPGGSGAVSYGNRVQCPAVPTKSPTKFPLPGGTKFPTMFPTKFPTTKAPTKAPTPWPSAAPTPAPTPLPSAAPTHASAIVVIYGEGTGSYQSEGKTYTGTISVTPGVKYSVALEVLRNDLASASEYVKDVTLDGTSIGGCNPDGGDYDCTFFACSIPAGTTITGPASGTIDVSMHFVGHSWVCDCDTSTWQCSTQNTEAGRTPMEAVARFTLTPINDDGLSFLNVDDHGSGEEAKADTDTGGSSLAAAATGASSSSPSSSSDDGGGLEAASYVAIVACVFVFAVQVLSCNQAGRDIAALREENAALTEEIAALKGGGARA